MVDVRMSVTADDAFDDAARVFVKRLGRSFRGDIVLERVERAIYSSDAGNYRVVPAVIVRPKDAFDVAAVVDAAVHCDIPVTARGAGTSCAGNAIGPGVIVDYSRYMNRIISIDPDSRTAVVQPGVIQGQLQAAAKPFGLRFGPDPSTWNRCTIGGMIGNNACGPHATAWGRTADNIINVQFIDGLGRSWDTEKHSVDDIVGLGSLVKDNLAFIRTNFGKFTRQVSGYSLEHLLPENHGDLAKFMVGTEGTLGLITQAQVRLVDIPDAPVLVALGFDTMVDAADAVPTVLKHKPLAVEGLDSRLVDVVRRFKGPGAVPALPAGQGWLLCEVGAKGMSVDDTLAAAYAMVRDVGVPDESVMVYPPGDDAAALWRIRADGAGLGGRTPLNADGSGNQLAWPGLEDAAVPPEKLGAYLRDFLDVMKRFNIDGLVYGHFGGGCIHVRLDMPLDTSDGVAHSKQFLTQCAQLIGRYGGSISGEHGDGRTRSELLQHMYPAHALDLFAQVKALFDPDNRLNPGVLTYAAGSRENPAPDPVDMNLRLPYAKSTPATHDGFSFHEDHGDFSLAVHRCTGVMKCRADNRGSGGFMCPSALASRREQDSTRGRARILQEAMNGTFVSGLNATEVLDALDLCLACKACSTDCPTGIDMAKYRSEVYHRIYTHGLRPRTHYFLGWLPASLRLLHRLPGMPALVNAAMKIAPLRKAAFAISGIDTRRAMPRLSNRPLKKWVKQQGITEATLDHITSKHVIVWADSFSHTLDGSGAKATVALLEKLGYHVVIPNDDICCGLTWITTGQLGTAREKLSHLVERLAPWAMAGVPIVGIEPSCSAVLRDDIKDLLPGNPKMLAVSEAVTTLAEFLVARGHYTSTSAHTLDLHDVTIVAQPHCHHYSVMGWQADRTLLKNAGANLVELAGCCGLAGNFGMEKGHYDMSVAVANNQLLPALNTHPDAIYLADGFSCRTQAQQLANRNGIHLAQLLLEHTR